MTTIIPRNTTLPATASQIVSTYSDNQSSVLVQVFEGERSMTRHCRCLGKFELSGIPPAARGVLQIEVTFELDANYTLRVTAIIKATGQKHTITVTKDDESLTKEQIDAMVEESERYKADDADRKIRIEAKNHIESFAYSVRNYTKDARVQLKLEADDKIIVENAVKAAIEWLEHNQHNSKEEYDQYMKQLKHIVQPIMNKFCI